MSTEIIATCTAIIVVYIAILIAWLRSDVHDLRDRDIKLEGLRESISGRRAA